MQQQSHVVQRRLVGKVLISRAKVADQRRANPEPRPK